MIQFDKVTIFILKSKTKTVNKITYSMNNKDYKPIKKAKSPTILNLKRRGCCVCKKKGLPLPPNS